MFVWQVVRPITCPTAVHLQKKPGSSSDACLHSSGARLWFVFIFCVICLVRLVEDEAWLWKVCLESLAANGHYGFFLPKGVGKGRTPGKQYSVVLFESKIHLYPNYRCQEDCSSDVYWL